jgi:hypothetical protein
MGIDKPDPPTRRIKKVELERMSRAVEASLEVRPRLLAVHRTELQAALSILEEGFNSTTKDGRNDYSRLLELAISRVTGLEKFSPVYATPLPRGNLLSAVRAVDNRFYGEIALVVKPHWAVGYRGDSVYGTRPGNLERPSRMARRFLGRIPQEEIITSAGDVTIVAVIGPRGSALAELCSAKGVRYIAN